MISTLTALVDLVEQRMSEEIDVASFAGEQGTTEYHLRRMFSSLASMPLSEYVRRRRMTLAAADVVENGELLGIAVRYGYGSTEAFSRAFRAIHGASPGDVRRDGGPLRTQPQIRFRLTIQGSTSMETRIAVRPAFTLIGYSTPVRLIHQGVNPQIQEFIAALPISEHARLKNMSNGEPPGLLQVSADVDPDYTEGTELIYMHGVSVDADTVVPKDLDAIDVTAGQWAIFRTEGPFPDALQSTWAATATDWFPSNPWRLRPGPSIVAVLDHADDFTTATSELWLPVERA